VSKRRRSICPPLFFLHCPGQPPTLVFNQSSFLGLPSSWEYRWVLAMPSLPPHIHTTISLIASKYFYSPFIQIRIQSRTADLCRVALSLTPWPRAYSTAQACCLKSRCWGRLLGWYPLSCSSITRISSKAEIRTEI
jgi:hypothetical protein